MEIIAKRMKSGGKLVDYDSSTYLDLSYEKFKAMGSFIYSNMDKNHQSAVGVQYEYLVVDCFYKSLTCTGAHFKLYLHPTLINCYTFQTNATNTKGPVLDGPHNGLTLILRSSPNINQWYERLDVMQNVESLRLAIHAPGTVPFMTKKALNIEPGKTTSISLALKTYKRLGSPYKDCREKEVFNLDSRIFKLTQGVCKEKCMIEKIQKKCNCTSTLFEDLTRSDHQYCSEVGNLSPTEFEERNKCEYDLAQGNENVDCMKCIWDCDQFDYDLQTTFSEWPQPDKIDYFVDDYVIYEYKNLTQSWRPCTDPTLLFYNLLMTKANLSTQFCPTRDRHSGKIPFSFRTLLNKQENIDYEDAVKKNETLLYRLYEMFAFMYEPGFPEMYEYVMDVPKSYYNVKKLKELNAKFVKDSFYRVNIYFSQTSVEQHVQEPSFSFPDFWSSIGGILGLWLGFSAMTIIEMSVFIFNLICNISCKKNSNVIHVHDKVTVKEAQ